MRPDKKFTFPNCPKKKTKSSPTACSLNSTSNSLKTWKLTNPNIPNKSSKFTWKTTIEEGEGRIRLPFITFT